MEKKTSKWQKPPVVKATQVAFDLETQLAQQVQSMAVDNGLTASSQIRQLLGLQYTYPKRPRLSITLSQADYQALGRKYGVDPADTIAVKRQMMQELIAILTNSSSD